MRCRGRRSTGRAAGKHSCQPGGWVRAAELRACTQGPLQPPARLELLRRQRLVRPPARPLPRLDARGPKGGVLQVVRLRLAAHAAHVARRAAKFPAVDGTCGRRRAAAAAVGFQSPAQRRGVPVSRIGGVCRMLDSGVRDEERTCRRGRRVRGANRACGLPRSRSECARATAMPANGPRGLNFDRWPGWPPMQNHARLQLQMHAFIVRLGVDLSGSIF